ncbi:MAG: CDP-alcohol phosphatidyltransferase family protein [Gammaproteobacteria bacterium]|nr:CDP-alcohol phosphatidyltransferase family protein [Gammaproteobacteria bacterium]
MIDARLRRIIDPPLDRIGAMLAGVGITANQVTVTGFFIGMLAVPLLAYEHYAVALAAIGANRLSDGLDGAVARHSGMTDLGGYLDIVADFVFYSAVVFGIILARPQDAVWGAFLIFSFIGTGTSFLAYAIFAEKRQLSTTIRGKKSIYYLGGLTEGFETIVALCLMCLFPAAFWLIALVFGMMCWLTTMSRVAWARGTLVETRV